MSRAQYLVPEILSGGRAGQTCKHVGAVECQMRAWGSKAGDIDSASCRAHGKPSPGPLGCVPALPLLWVLLGGWAVVTRLCRPPPPPPP